MTDTGEQAPKDVIGFLDFYLVKKAPIQLPEGVKEAIVRFGPWIALVLLILSLPLLLLALGIGTLGLPFGGVYYASGFGLTAIILCVELGLLIAALPGLFGRRMSGWKLLFYSRVINIVWSLLVGAIVTGLLFGLISLYLLFQIRTLYKN